MSQVELILTCFKAVELAAVLSISAFIVCYSLWAAWWSNSIGRTIVIKDILLIVALTPTVLSLFFDFSRLTSIVAAWIDVAVIGLITPVMIWRTIVFLKIHNDRKAADALASAEQAETERTQCEQPPAGH